MTPSPPPIKTMAPMISEYSRTACHARASEPVAPHMGMPMKTSTMTAMTAAVFNATKRLSTWR